MKEWAFAIAVSVMLAFLVGVSASGLTALSEQQGKPIPAQHHAAPLGGKVVPRKAGELHRLASPIAKAPLIHPLPVAGHSWHWHPAYGRWLALPVGTVQTVVLPETFALPAQVQVYETATATSVQAVCPHCGQPLTIEIK